MSVVIYVLVHLDSFFWFGVKCTTLWCNCVSKVGFSKHEPWFIMSLPPSTYIDIIDEAWVSWLELMPSPPWNMVDLDLAKDSDIDFDDLATRQQTAHDSTITISRYVELEQFFGCPLDGPKPVKSQHGRSKGMMFTALDRGHDMTGWGCFVAENTCTWLMCWFLSSRFNGLCSKPNFIKHLRYIESR